MTSANARQVEHEWQQIDLELREIARQRGALDARETVLLCSASRHQIWRNLGKASFLEYLEDVLGYTPKCARERVRVAVALERMPAMTDALASGELKYSAVRELTRVATAETEASWCEAARNKNVRQVEELVSVHAPGDQPSDPPRPDLKPHVVRFEISPATFARLRKVQQVLTEQGGTHVDDDALIATLCAAVLDGGGADIDQGRAKHQVMTTICEVCQQGWQLGGGRSIAVTPADVAIAECDAQRIGSDREPGQATQDVAPKVRRFVWRRDEGKCQVPGCRAASNIDVHHIVPRHRGGGHEAENLTLLCSGHHRRLHEETLIITGRAPDLVVSWKAMPHVGHATSEHALDRHAGVVPAPRPEILEEPPRVAPHVGPSKYERVVMRTEAIQGITQLGFPKAIARSAVDAALEGAPPEITLEKLIAAALQRTRS